ncbi:MAG: hypothetical protein LBC21_00815 [Oscillospiraceae bacterium]|jgi:hypothetical protein|nr:hypothetical protein [Oscillospiraceae bacterium]
MIGYCWDDYNVKSGDISLGYAVLYDTWEADDGGDGTTEPSLRALCNDRPIFEKLHAYRSHETDIDPVMEYITPEEYVSEDANVLLDRYLEVFFPEIGK